MKPVVHALLAFVGELVPLAPVSPARNRRVATQAGGISELDPTAAHSSNRSYPVVLVVAPLVCLADGADLRAAHHRNRLAA
jgi:hypothetical protein